MKEFVIRRGKHRRSVIDYERELNPQQLEVVLAGDGPLLVIAGAGTGKTRTLTYRVARLVESGVPPSRILLLTFTNKAAREMIQRVERLLPEMNTRIPFGGTFHHVGNLILRRWARLAGLKQNFTILDREDAKDLVDDVAAPWHERHTRFPRGDVLIELFSLSISTGRPLDRIVETRRPEFIPLLGDILDVQKRYHTRKRRNNVVDFDDLLLRWRDLLRDHDDFRDHQRNMFRHILVDEYQDTNRLQAEICELIAGPEGNLMVVGDDAQSIYSFRGADFGNIIDFPRRFPRATQFRLETNYRSTPQILAVANSSIRHNRRQFEKTLRPVQSDGPRPDVVMCGDEYEQAKFVVDRITRLHEEGVDLHEMAVLYRAHFHSLELQVELQSAGIPYEVRSGMRFFEQAHIKDVVAYLKILSNDKDEMAWKRVLRMVPRVGPKTADRIWKILAACESAVRAIGESKVRDAAPQGAREGLRTLAGLLRRLANEECRRNPSTAIRWVLEEYEKYARVKFPNASARIDDVRRFGDFAMRFESCEALLSELALAGAMQVEDPAIEPDDDDALVLSTVHQAKGLEWKVVFILWLVEGRFPDSRACLEEEGLEEERRLFYVAVTRARRELYLCHPQSALERGFQKLLRPSRFLRELDPDTVELARVS